MSAYFVDVPSLEVVITERPHGQKVFSVGSKSERRSLHLQAGRNLQRRSRCEGWLQQREMRG